MHNSSRGGTILAIKANRLNDPEQIEIWGYSVLSVHQHQALQEPEDLDRTLID